MDLADGGRREIAGLIFQHAELDGIFRESRAGREDKRPRQGYGAQPPQHILGHVGVSYIACLLPPCSVMLVVRRGMSGDFARLLRNSSQ